jgi:AmiR/NasT family two-component response regulator
VKDKIEKLKPDIILIFLNEDPSRGEMAAKFIQKSILARTIPIIFVDGKSKHVKKIKFQYPNAFYTKST